MSDQTEEEEITIVQGVPPFGMGELHTVTMKGMRRDHLEEWLKLRGVRKCYVYDSEAGRLLSWFTSDTKEKA